MMMKMIMMMMTMTAMMKRAKPYQIKPNNTKMNITQSFLKLQATDFAWQHNWTMGTNQMMRIDTKTNLKKSHTK